jgi:transcriptional regulator with XRE-family HTH domain
MAEDIIGLYKEIGALIARARRNVDGRTITQAELAERIGLSRTSVVNIECGRHHVPVHLLFKIATVLGVQPITLLPTFTVSSEAIGVPDDIHGKLMELPRGDRERVKQIITPMLKETIHNATRRSQVKGDGDPLHGRRTETTNSHKKGRKKVRGKG